MRMDSVDPLIDGVPVHDGAKGIACPWLAYLPSNMRARLWSPEGRWFKAISLSATSSIDRSIWVVGWQIWMQQNTLVYSSIFLLKAEPKLTIVVRESQASSTEF